MKKILALVLAALMLVAIAAPAMAAAAVADTAISVSGLQTGDALKFYQVLTWNQTNGAWELTSDFSTLTFSANQTAEQVVAAIVDGITQEEANAISALASSATGIDPTTTQNGTATYTLPATNGETNLDALGVYMAIITAGAPSYIYNPVFVAADFDSNASNSLDAGTETYGPNGLAKKQEITLLKTTSDSNSAVDTAIDSYVGQEVTFYVDTTIPVFLDSYQNPSFDLVDEIKSSGIELVAGSIEVTLGSGNTAKTYAKTASGNKEAYDTTKFTVAEVSKTKYTVNFVEDYLDDNDVAVPVHIEYKGTITNAATFNVNEDNNEVTVTYSNGPEEEKAALRDRTNHYTFSIGGEIFGAGSEHGKTWELVKVAVDGEGNPVVEKREVSSWSTQEDRHPLAGATFALFTKDPDTNKLVAYTNANYTGQATCTTEADGVITFTGLAAGTYYLQETEAPKGYIKDDRTVEITITPTYDEVIVDDTVENGIKVKGYTVKKLISYTVTVNNVHVYDETVSTEHPDGYYGAASGNIISTYTYDNEGPSIETLGDTTVNDSDLINTKGVELPSTGGMGTTLFYIGGGLLALIAVVLLVTKRRMNGND